MSRPKALSVILILTMGWLSGLAVGKVYFSPPGPPQLLKPVKFGGCYIMHDNIVVCP